MAATMILNTPATTNDELVDMIRTIEKRLHDGYAKIEAGIAEGRNVERWEAIWFDLLEEYKILIDELAA